MGARAWEGWVAPSPRPPDLEPVFGPASFTPGTTCDDIHSRGPIPEGSRCCCMACHRSGVERQVRHHVKPADGQIRDGWTAPTPTKVPDGPGGRGAAPADGTGKAAPRTLKGGRR